MRGHLRAKGRCGSESGPTATDCISTTRRPMDGAYIGRYKVIVTAWMPGAGDTSGVTAEPERPDIPKVFHNAATSPLAVEVTVDGPNQFDFELAKQAAAKR